tara:strand:+ start:621 stop:782 length:162 start_codon:yes stop_codon:yes gene_type:complete
MAWKLKKEWEGKRLDSIRIPLEDLSQKQIENLNESVRSNLFVKEEPKKKKSYK